MDFSKTISLTSTVDCCTMFFMQESRVIISKNALKELERIPKNIVGALMTWIASVEENGIFEVRKISGYHDEPLKGDRKGQRSIKLNKAYRAIYEMAESGEIEITVVEVNKHKY